MSSASFKSAGRFAARGAALGLLIAAAPAGADTATIRISGYVPQSCAGSLTLTQATGPVRQGAIQTSCNTSHSVTLFYPAELGAVRVAYRGASIMGHAGTIVLDGAAPPRLGQTPLLIELLDAPSAPVGGGFSVVLAPQGF